jgi:nucleotidyltransferase substrate binding protein (TIGR01987 family)
MTENDIRWKQRLANYDCVLRQLEGAVELAGTRELSELERQGLIRAFVYTHELAWNLMKDWFTYQGHTAITGSRDAVREAFNRGLVEDGEGWMEMIASRNQTAHAYNEAVASRITERITNRYTELFKAFRDTMVAKAAHN